MNEKCDVVVIGAGVSGLAASWRLQSLGADVRLIESTSSVGGVAQTEHRDGFLLEKGPFNVLVRDPGFQALLEDLAAELKVIHPGPSARRRYICRHDELHELSPNPIQFLASRLLSWRGKWRCLAGLILSARSRNEESIDAATRRRFGNEFADVITSAAIAGIYAGAPSGLSLSACLPSVSKWDRQTRSPILSVIAGMWKRLWKPSAPSRHRGLISFAGGLGELSNSIAGRLGACVLRNHVVQSIELEPFPVVHCMHEGQPTTIHASHIVLAVSAPAASRLLARTAPRASQLIQSIKSHSLVVLNMGFRAEDIDDPLDGFGFLVPQCESFDGLLGVLWADSVFPHQAPPGHRLLRVMLGGDRDPGACNLSNDELVERALRLLRKLNAVRNDPVLVDICRYRHAIPQYQLGYAELVRQIDKALSVQPRIGLIGNYLHGVSINDSVAFAIQTADRIGKTCLQGKHDEPQAVEPDATTAAIAAY